MAMADEPCGFAHRIGKGNNPDMLRQVLSCATTNAAGTGGGCRRAVPLRNPAD